MSNKTNDKARQDAAAMDPQDYEDIRQSYFKVGDGFVGLENVAAGTGNEIEEAAARLAKALAKVLDSDDAKLLGRIL